ncbi:MAG: STM3941 family protein [Pelobium sp.]
MLNQNETTTIEFDNSKRRKNVLIGIGLILFCAVFIFIIATADVVKITYLTFFIVMLVCILVMVGKSVIDMNSKNQVGLVLSQTGITFNGTSAAKKIGEISWTAIETLEKHEVHSTKQLYLKLKNPQKYIKEKSKIEMANNGVFVNATELKINFEELISLTNDYLDKYGERKS